MTELSHIPNDAVVDIFRPRATAPAPTRGGIDLKHWAEEFAEVYRVSEALSKTPFVPKEMTGRTADVAAAIMRGRELGLDPFDALGSIYIVHGRVGFYAEFMRRRIVERGHKFRVIESTDSRAVVEARRKDDPDSDKVRVTFTAEQAKKGNINLGNFPADKLVARATSRMCKQHVPDVLAGSLIAEDLIDGVIPADDEPPAPAPDTSPASAVQRARKPRAAKAASTQPPAAPRAAVADDTEIAELLGDQPQPGPQEAAQAQPPEPLDDEPIPVDVVEADEADAEPSQDLITPAQLKKLSILLREAGFDTPESKHGFTSAAINREIGSAKELTKDEATTVIDILQNGQ